MSRYFVVVRSTYEKTFAAISAPLRGKDCSAQRLRNAFEKAQQDELARARPYDRDDETPPVLCLLYSVHYRLTHAKAKKGTAEEGEKKVESTPGEDPDGKGATEDVEEEEKDEYTKKAEELIRDEEISEWTVQENLSLDHLRAIVGKNPCFQLTVTSLNPAMRHYIEDL